MIFVGKITMHKETNAVKINLLRKQHRKNTKIVNKIIFAQMVMQVIQSFHSENSFTQIEFTEKSNAIQKNFGDKLILFA